MMLPSEETVRVGQFASAYSSALPNMWPASWAAVPPVLFTNHVASMLHRYWYALFPQEWLRDPQSKYLTTNALHDVPWDDPQLLKGYVDLRKTAPAPAGIPA